MKLTSVPVPVVPTGTALASRQGVLAIEAAIAQLPQIALRVENDFAPGIYYRRLYIPAGVALAGRIHRYEHMNVVLEGEIAVRTEKGLTHIKGPTMFTSPAGVKRAGYTVKDTIWMTVHPNPDNITNVEELERMLTVDSFDELGDSVIEGEFECQW